MNGYDLTASIISSLASLAWPAATIVCVYLFRQRLNELLPRLHLRHKETELSFQIEAAKADAEQLPEAPKRILPPTAEESSKFLQLAKLSPKGAILGAWSDLEVRLRDLARSQHDLEDIVTSRTSALAIMRQFRANGLVTVETFSVFDDLRRIRNQVAHNDYPDGIDISDAVDFWKSLERVLASIEDIPSTEEQFAAAGLEAPPRSY